MQKVRIVATGLKEWNLPSHSALSIILVLSSARKNQIEDDGSSQKRVLWPQNGVLASAKISDVYSSMALLLSPTYGTYYRTQIPLIPAPNKRIKWNRFHLSLAALLKSISTNQTVPPNGQINQPEISASFLSKWSKKALRCNIHPNNHLPYLSALTVHSTTTILSGLCSYLHYRMSLMFCGIWPLAPLIIYWPP